MRKSSEYRANARECRRLASRTERGEDRERLLRMAADWERLAHDRAELLERHPELDSPEAEAEDAGETGPARPRR